MKHREQITTRIVKWGLSISCIGAIASGALLALGGIPIVDVFSLTAIPARHHFFHFHLALDSLSSVFVIVTTLLAGTVGAFSRSYLHRDPGHSRFFFLILLFALGMEFIFMATSFEVLFVGWEIIGLSSALLISFFFERQATADNSLKAFWAYRVSDTALLVCSMLFSVAGVESVLVSSRTDEPLPLGALGIAIPALVIAAAIPKSAQFPFSGWLPRAMEGPTPSSAIFYGGLSVHAGYYLLLRFQHSYALPQWFFTTIVIVGLVSAMYGYLLGQVQSDVKSMLACGSITHVGLMFAEVGMGFTMLSVLHFVGHAFLRSYQILSAGSLVHEGRRLGIARDNSVLGRVLPRPWLEWLNSVAFDLSFRDGSDPSSAVNILERVSDKLAALEQRLALGITGLLELFLPRPADYRAPVVTTLKKEEVR